MTRLRADQPEPPPGIASPLYRHRPGSRRGGLLGLVARGWRVRKEEGVVGAARMTLYKGTSALAYLFHRRRPRRTFAYKGQVLTEFLGLYNTTWRNERGAEIPIARDFLQRHPGLTLEVGNVLGHYGVTGHLVVDKYEQAAGILNVDVTDYRPDELYDAIVCVSTLEHVGWDESPRDATKVDRAIAHLRDLLKPSGRMLVTFALRYNTHLDALVAEQRVGANLEIFLHRGANGWEECGREVAFARARYIGPVQGGSTIWIGEFGSTAS